MQVEDVQRLNSAQTEQNMREETEHRNRVLHAKIISELQKLTLDPATGKNDKLLQILDFIRRL